MKLIIFILALFVTEVSLSQSVKATNEKAEIEYLKVNAQLKKVFKQIRDSIPVEENKVRVALQKSEEAWLYYRKKRQICVSFF